MTQTDNGPTKEVTNLSDTITTQDSGVTKINTSNNIFKNAFSKLTNFKNKKRIGLYVLISFILVGLILIGSLLVDHKKQTANKNIVIGDTTITPGDIAGYKKALDDFKTKNPLVIYDGDTKQIAIDDLVLHAAFLKEAKDNNAYLTDAERDATFRKTFENIAQRETYYNSLKRDYDGKVTLYKGENEAYKLKLSNKVLAEKSLLIMSVPFDSPYFAKNDDNPETIKKLRKEAIGRLNNEFIPLLKNKATRDEIGKKADVNTMDEDKSDDSNPQPYFDGLVTNVEYRRKYSTGKVNFNDLPKNEYHGLKMDGLSDTDDKIAELKNVGDYTQVFPSRAGSYMIIRLESKNNGKYNSFTDLLNSYKTQYKVKEKTALADFATRKVATFLGETIIAVTTPGLKKANALHNGTCGDHDVAFVLRSYISGTFYQISGTGVSFSRGAATCGFSGSRSFTSPTYFPDNCWNPEPTWARTADPPGWGYDGQDWGDGTVGGASGSGWPLWTASNINSVGTIYINFYYSSLDQAPSGNLTNADCGTIQWNSTDPQGAPNVRIRINGTQQGGDQPSSGTMAFPVSYKTYSSYSVSAVVVNVGPSGAYEQQLTGSPTTIGPCDNPPSASLSTATCSTISWTASDPQGTPAVNVTIDGTSVYSGSGGGSIAYPYTYKADGAVHSVRLYVTNVGPGPMNGNVTQGSNSPTSVPSCDIPPTITMTPDCLLTQVTVSVTDPDYQPVSAEYRIGSGGWVTVSSIANPPGTFTIPMASINQYDITTVYARSNGRTLNGNTGPATVNQSVAYKRSGAGNACLDRDFSITATPAKPVLDSDESPTKATFVTSMDADIVDVGGTPPLKVKGISLTRSQYIKRNISGANDNITNIPLPAVPFNLDVNTDGTTSNSVTRGPTLSPTPNVGDEVCHTVSAKPPGGKVNTTGDINTSNPGSTSSIESCEKVVAKPYFRVYNSDVSAGFSPNCSGWSTGVGSSRILGYNDGTGKGSATQLAAFALGDGAPATNDIDGFTTAAGRTTDPKPPTGLTFSNIGGSGFGAQFGAGFCPPDYFANRPKLTPQISTTASLFALNIALDGNFEYNGNTTIITLGATITAGKKIVIYVNGDAFINGDINYASAGWLTPANIPSFALVVKGDIYIDSSVVNLDGFYVAQPKDDGSAGQVYTCAFGAFGVFTKPNATQLNNNCNTQLKINGAINAKRIRMLRTIGSLKDSTATEPRTSATAAEQFIFGAESWINPTLNNGGGNSQYDSISSVAPTL